MKKIFMLLLFFSILFTSASFAQFQFSIEPAVGMNYNIQHNNEFKDNATGVGPVGALKLHFKFTKVFGLITGFSIYDDRRATFSDKNSWYGNFEVTYKFAYFGIDILPKISFPFGLYFIIGPGVGINIVSKGEVKSGSLTDETNINNPQVNVELKAGLGYDIKLSKKIGIVPQITYGYGFTKVVKDWDWKIMTLQFLVGAKINLN